MKIKTVLLIMTITIALTACTMFKGKEISVSKVKVTEDGGEISLEIKDKKSNKSL